MDEIRVSDAQARDLESARAMSWRSPKLLKSAAGTACCACFVNDGTTVPAHVNSVALGKGIANKAPDYFHARLCQSCHDQYDGRKPGWGDAEERAERFMWAYFRTVQAWFEEGIVGVE